jgi:hypothetical protein
MITLTVADVAPVEKSLANTGTINVLLLLKLNVGAGVEREMVPAVSEITNTDSPPPVSTVRTGPA